MVRIQTDTPWLVLLKVLRDETVQRKEAGGPPSVAVAAWGEMRRRVGVYARIVLRSRGGLDPDDLEDVTSAILLKLQDLRLLERMLRLATPAGYLYAMIRNAAVDAARRRPHWVVPLEEEVVFESGLGESEESLEGQGALVGWLRGELKQLSDEEQILLELRFWRGMGIGQVAAEMGLTYSATAVRLFRLVRKLRERLEARNL